MHVPICRYSYQMLKYFGAVSFIVIQAHIHTIMFIPMRNNREVNAAYALTKNSTVITQITQFVDTIDHESEYAGIAFLERRLAFMISCYRFFLDNCMEAERVIPKEATIVESFKSFTENGVPILNRGSMISDITQMDNYECSLNTLPYSKDVQQAMTLAAYNSHDRAIHNTYARYTSFRSVVSHLLVRMVTQRKDFSDLMARRELKILCRVLMTMLFTWDWMCVSTVV